MVHHKQLGGALDNSKTSFSCLGIRSHALHTTEPATQERRMHPLGSSIQRDHTHGVLLSIISGRELSLKRANNSSNVSQGADGVSTKSAVPALSYTHYMSMRSHGT